MKSKSFGGNKPAMLTTNVHLETMTKLSVDVVMDETPLLNIGNEVTLFFMSQEALQRTIEALQDLQRGSRMIGMTWNTYVDASPERDVCPVHGDACHKVWHKNDAKADTGIAAG